MCCRYSGIHCVTIRGWVKGSTYSPGSQITRAKPNHFWNGVFIDGDWQLVDLKWSKSCKCNPANPTKHQLVSDFFFLTEPSQLIFTHFPANSDWQLLRPAVIDTEYEGYPVVHSAFFNAGLKLLHEIRGLIHVYCGIYTLTLGYSGQFSFTFKLSNEKIQYDLSRYIMKETTTSKLTLYFRAPCDGDFTLAVYIKAAEQDHYTRACQYKLCVEGVQTQDTVSPFPRCAGNDWGPGKLVQKYSIIPSHNQAIVKASDGKARIVFGRLNGLCLYARLVRDGFSNAALSPCIKKDKSRDEVSFSILLQHRGEYGLEIYVNNPDVDGDKCSHQCQYIISYSDKDMASVYGKVYDRPEVAFNLQAISAGQNGGLRSVDSTLSLNQSFSTLPRESATSSHPFNRSSPAYNSLRASLPRSPGVLRPSTLPLSGTSTPMHVSGTATPRSRYVAREHRYSSASTSVASPLPTVYDDDAVSLISYSTTIDYANESFRAIPSSSASCFADDDTVSVISYAPTECANESIRAVASSSATCFADDDTVSVISYAPTDCTNEAIRAVTSPSATGYTDDTVSVISYAATDCLDETFTATASPFTTNQSFATSGELSNNIAIGKTAQSPTPEEVKQSFIAPGSLTKNTAVRQSIRKTARATPNNSSTVQVVYRQSSCKLPIGAVPSVGAMSNLKDALKTRSLLSELGCQALLEKKEITPAALPETKKIPPATLPKTKKMPPAVISELKEAVALPETKEATPAALPETKEETPAALPKPKKMPPPTLAKPKLPEHLRSLLR